MTLEPDTQVWTTGMNYPGYLPNPDDVRVFATQDLARLDVAGRIEEWADAALDDEMAMADVNYSTAEEFDNDSERSSLGAQAQAESVRHNADQDYSQGAFSVQVDNMSHQPPVFWAQPSSAGDYFGDQLDGPEALELEQDIRLQEFAHGDLFKPGPLDHAEMHREVGNMHIMTNPTTVPKITGLIQ